MNYYYATLHFVVTIGVLVWLFRRHPGPLRGDAPGPLRHHGGGPARLLPLPAGAAPADERRRLHRHGAWSTRPGARWPPATSTHMSNQYAAMPSMHIGWSLWCGLTIFALAAAAVGAGPGRALPGGHADRDRRDGQPLLAGRGGRHDLPGLRLRPLLRLVRARCRTACRSWSAARGAPETRSGPLRSRPPPARVTRRRLRRRRPARQRPVERGAPRRRGPAASPRR